MTTHRPYSHTLGTIRRVIVCICIVSSAIITGCSDDPAAPPADTLPGAGEPIVYSRHIQPILSRSCGGSGCHMNGEAASELALDSWNSVMSGSHSGAMVIPYWGAKSPLLQHINTDTLLAPIRGPKMPPTHSLEMEQIRVIKRWIDEGAKNDAGEVWLSDPNRSRIYVTAQSEDKVAIIDAETEHVIRYLSVGGRPDSSTPPEAPHNLLLSAGGEHLYVNFIAGGIVEKYDTRTLAKLGTVQVGSAPAQMVMTSDGSAMYVSNFDISLNEKFIVRIDPRTMTPVSRIEDVGFAPHSLALSRDEKFLYAANSFGDNVAEIDLASGTVIRRIPMVPGAPTSQVSRAIEPYHLLLSQDGGSLWVSCRASGEVRIIDLAAGRVVDSIRVGKSPLIIEQTPNGSQVWVPNQGSNSVSVISTATRQVVATIAEVEHQPHAVAFSPDGELAYVSCENQISAGNLHHPITGASVTPGAVYLFKTANGASEHTIETGGFSAGIAVTR